VVRWYHDHGYQFVVVTDHEQITDVAPLNAQLRVAGRFLVLPGEEITQRVADDTHPRSGARRTWSASGSRAPCSRSASAASRPE
jgi:predicted metal-dependent phosphoesterase TrpH